MFSERLELRILQNSPRTAASFANDDALITTIVGQYEDD